MSTLTASRCLASAAALSVALTSFAITAPGATAATTYSAPLQSAVRALPVAAESNAGYDRELHFGGDWLDVDDDCQNTRHEVLIAESQAEPTFSSSGCTVTAGQWTTLYDDQTYSAASEVEIDHLVPVSEAWGSGARLWTQAQRVAFYNDLGHADALNAMPSALNQAKGASGPEQWLPPANVCRYIAAWTAVKIRWSLSVDPTEQAALISQADACPATTLTVETVDVPAPPIVPPVTEQPTQVTVNARTIDYGRTTALTVVGTTGAVVDLYASSRGSSPRIIRTATLSAGRVAWTLQPGETTSFFAQVRGGDRSDTVTVNVRRTVTIGIRQAAGIYTFTGVVNRPVAGLQVTLARLLTTGRVVGVAATRTNAAGAYTIRTRLAPGLSGYYALTAPTADLQPGRSRLYGLVVPTPRPVARPVVTAPVVRPPAPPPPPRVSYANCTAVRQTYPHGIGRVGAVDRTTGARVTTWVKDTAGYNRAIDANSDLDRDRDGIACEQR